MGVSDVHPLNGPTFTPPTVTSQSIADATSAQQSAETFAALLRAQMDSMMTSASLSSFDSGGGLLGGGGLGGSLLGGSLLGGSGGLGGDLTGLLLMQTLQPLTDALNKLIDRLDGLNGFGEPPQVRQIPTPESLPFRDLIEGLAVTYRVPAAFLGAVMMAESSGDPNAVGDSGKSVGLFQLHEEGMGAGLGDLRLDPELNASIGARGLAEGWHQGLRRDLAGEDLVRFAYDHRFNPGGGNGYQGDAVYSYFRFYDALDRRDGLVA